MADPFDFKTLVLPDRLRVTDLVPLFPLRPTVRILVVADMSVSFTGTFGVGMVVDLIRANADGFVRFEVDLARLGVQGSNLSVDGSPGPRDPKFLDFRFSSEVDGTPVIDGYDEIWCFGFAPGNDRSLDDNNIWNSQYASTNTDLAVLTRWMNDGGGVLAMGDHHYLGAAMCARIPRVGSMRRWTNAQNVPSEIGPGRFDTNRPQNPSQDPDVTPNPEQIPFGAQADDVPQKIEWKRYSLWSYFLQERRYRPHPILCGKDLGVIDVLPDHPHEGWVYEDADVDVNATYSFDGEAGSEYPSVGASQPRPEVIAWATTLPDPPYNHQKGPSPARRFGVIGVYDGDTVDVGRVAVDSTWHHWMDVNLIGLRDETPDTEYQKIVRYFRNCAVWLARKRQRRQMLSYTTFISVTKAVYFEDFVRRQTIFDLGGKAIDVLGRLTSDCLVRDWLQILVPPILRETFIRQDRPIPEPEPPPPPLPDPCWSCPPLEVLHRSVLGGIVHEILPLRDELDKLHADPKAKLRMSPKEFERATTQGAKRGLEEFQGMVKQNLDHLARFAKQQDSL